MPAYYLTDIHSEYLDKDSHRAYEEAKLQSVNEDYTYAIRAELALPEERLSEQSLNKSIPTPDGAYYYRVKNSKGFYETEGVFCWSKNLDNWPVDIKSWIEHNKPLIEQYIINVTKVYKGQYTIWQINY